MADKKPSGRPSSRQRIVQSALALFAQQGITATTTKEIAEQAGVNEVTLFRQFGSKQGLLLAVLQDAPITEKMQAALTDILGANEPLVAYGEAGLALLGNVPELVRSLIWEAGQSPRENQQALSQLLKQTNQQTVSYLNNEQIDLFGLDIEETARLLNTLLLGHAVLTFSTQASAQADSLWPTPTDFLSAVDTLFLSGKAAPQRAMAGGNASAMAGPTAGGSADAVADLPAEVVRQLFQSAKKHSPQAYALVYVLFGAGLTLAEAATLSRHHIFATKTQHLLTISGAGGSMRQVPVNRWIMGNRYGTYQKNPLSQWLKGRQDDQFAVFVSLPDPKKGDAKKGNAKKANANNEDAQNEEANNGEPELAARPLGEADLANLWQEIAAEIPTGTGATATPFQARQTWCIELLMKDISLENLSILSGLSLVELEPYGKRAKEKAAVEAAIAIDQK